MDQVTPNRASAAATGPTDTDDLWRRKEVESPCIRLCSVHPTAGICIGCHRTVAEIGGWNAMTAEQRHAIMDELPGRKDRLRKRRGGRAGRGAE